jgi:glycosyltransferase involved in cell wall biosynthesis
MLDLIIPVHNGERYLLPAIQSVFDQQVPLELQIIDDGSTDGTVEILKQLQPPDWVHLSWSSHPKGGPSAARNRAIRNSCSSAIVFLDSDDLLTPGILQSLLQEAKQHPDEIIWAKTQWTDLDLNPLHLHCHWLMGMGATLWPRSVFERIGLLDESVIFSEDTDFFLRCREADINFFKKDEVAQLYRRHPNNLTKDLAHSQKAMVASIQRSLKRQREKR